MHNEPSISAASDLPPPPTEIQKWQLDQNNLPGPRQIADFNDTVRKLMWYADMQTEISGVRGGEEHRSTSQHVFGGGVLNPVPRKLLIEFQTTNGVVLSRKNIREFTAGIEALHAPAKAAIPVVDNRISPEEDVKNKAAQKQRFDEQNAKIDGAKAAWNAILAKKPSWAAAAIIAEEIEDESDSMTDYFGSKTLRTVAIGWRRGAREDFAQLRRAAASFPETAHLAPGCDVWRISASFNRNAEDGSYHNGHNAWVRLAGSPDPGRIEYPTEAAAKEAIVALGEIPDFITLEMHKESIEHRDNHSMGAGNYLKAGHRHSTGWQVRSMGLGETTYRVIEDGLTNSTASAPPAPDGESAELVPGEGYEIQKHYHTKRGADMYLVVLTNRVDDSEFSRLKRSATDAGGWYSRKWGRCPTGFAFGTPEQASSWASSAVRTGVTA